MFGQEGMHTVEQTAPYTIKCTDFKSILIVMRNLVKCENSAVLVDLGVVFDANGEVLDKCCHQLRLTETPFPEPAVIFTPIRV